MLQVSPAFTDAAFQEIALYSPFEELLGNRYEYAAFVFPIAGKISVAQRTHAAILAFGKKSFNAFLAVQSF